MRCLVRLFPALFLCAGLCGCGPNTPADSDPPPGVRKNEQRNTGANPPKKEKPILADPKKGTP